MTMHIGQPPLVRKFRLGIGLPAGCPQRLRE